MSLPEVGVGVKSMSPPSPGIIARQGPLWTVKFTLTVIYGALHLVKRLSEPVTTYFESIEHGQEQVWNCFSFIAFGALCAITIASFTND